MRFKDEPMLFNEYGLIYRVIVMLNISAYKGVKKHIYKWHEIRTFQKNKDGKEPYATRGQSKTKYFGLARVEHVF